MKRFNKNSRKKFFKLTALTLAMVTAMSVAKPCEVMAASATGSINYQGRTVNCQLNGADTRISASTVYSASGLVLWISLSGDQYSVSNPLAPTKGKVWTETNTSSPTTAAAYLSNETGYKFKSATSIHGVSETIAGYGVQNVLSINF